MTKSGKSSATNVRDHSKILIVLIVMLPMFMRIKSASNAIYATKASALKATTTLIWPKFIKATPIVLANFAAKYCLISKVCGVMSCPSISATNVLLNAKFVGKSSREALTFVGTFWTFTRMKKPSMASCYNVTDAMKPSSSKYSWRTT